VSPFPERAQIRRFNSSMVIAVITRNNFRLALKYFKYERSRTKGGTPKKYRLRPSREEFLRKNFIRWSMWKRYSDSLINAVKKQKYLFH
jgi:hypothetical protein